MECCEEEEYDRAHEGVSSPRAYDYNVELSCSYETHFHEADPSTEETSGEPDGFVPLDAPPPKPSCPPPRPALPPPRVNGKTTRVDAPGDGPRRRASSVVDQHPITGTPTRRTNLLRLRGNYGPSQMQFVVENLCNPPFNMRITRSDVNWDVMWTMRVKDNEFALLAPWQKVNFFPGFQHLCRKDLLHKAIVVMKRRCNGRIRWIEDTLSGAVIHRPPIVLFPLEEIDIDDLKRLAECRFWPMGYNLEKQSEREEFERILEEDSPSEDNLYIIKKPFSSNGRAVYVVGSKSKYEKLISEGGPCYPPSQHFPLAQKYIHNVQLFDGFKFTIRVYVAVTAFNPMRAYAYRNGLLRICSKKYCLDVSSLEDEYVHIDSLEVNEKNHNPESISEEYTHEGLRCDIQSYFGMLQEQGVNTDEVWERMKEAIALSLISSEEVITRQVMKVVKMRSHAYEILGFDVLLDSSFNAYILEINHTPALTPHTEIENAVKKSMLGDLFKMVDITNKRKPLIAKESAEIWSTIEKLNDPESECSIKNQINPLILEKFDVKAFTKGDCWNLIEMEMENDDSGDYDRLLPNARYAPFMRQQRNILASRWIREGLSYKDLLST